MADEVGKDGPKRDRSPKFPYISLAKAIERIEVLYDKAKRYETRVADIAKDWNLSAKSSSMDRSVAAIQSFGLIEDSGSGENRKIKLSEMGARVLLDTRPGVRDALLAEAALKPPAIAEYARKWSDGRPDEAHALSQLQFEGGFTAEAAKIFLRVFDETIRFAVLREAEKRGDINMDDSREDGSVRGEAEVGDLVQVEIDGALVLPSPVRLRAVEMHEGKKWAFIAGSETGIPVEQIILHSKAAPPIPGGITPPTLPETAMTPLPQNIAKGEREWLRGPLSKDVSYRLIVSGEVGPREIGKLIKLLEAQKIVLLDDEEGNH